MLFASGEGEGLKRLRQIAQLNATVESDRLFVKQKPRRGPCLERELGAAESFGLLGAFPIAAERSAPSRARERGGAPAPSVARERSKARDCRIRRVARCALRADHNCGRAARCAVTRDAYSATDGEAKSADRARDHARRRRDRLGVRKVRAQLSDLREESADRLAKKGLSARKTRGKAHGRQPLLSERSDHLFQRQRAPKLACPARGTIAGEKDHG